jgi:hypothetical protein
MNQLPSASWSFFRDDVTRSIMLWGRSLGGEAASSPFRSSLPLPAPILFAMCATAVAVHARAMRAGLAPTNENPAGGLREPVTGFLDPDLIGEGDEDNSPYCAEFQPTSEAFHRRSMGSVPPLLRISASRWSVIASKYWSRSLRTLCSAEILPSYWMNHSAPSLNSSPAMTRGGAPLSFMLPQRLSALPASAESLCAFLADQATLGKRASTLGRRLAAVRYFHRAAGYESPTGDEKVKAVLSGIRRTIGAAPVRKKAATSDLVLGMVGGRGRISPRTP